MSAMLELQDSVSEKDALRKHRRMLGDLGLMCVLKRDSAIKVLLLNQRNSDQKQELAAKHT
jgi:hypothetical protein